VKTTAIDEVNICLHQRSRAGQRNMPVKVKNSKIPSSPIGARYVDADHVQEPWCLPRIQDACLQAPQEHHVGPITTLKARQATRETPRGFDIINFFWYRS
jgi:hypothetical protein